jgi:hypothetical protein
LIGYTALIFYIVHAVGVSQLIDVIL